LLARINFCHRISCDADFVNISANTMQYSNPAGIRNPAKKQAGLIY